MTSAERAALLEAIAALGIRRMSYAGPHCWMWSRKECLCGGRWGA